MKTIWKFELPSGGITKMPANAEVLCVQSQNGNPCLWALVNSDEPMVEMRYFKVYGTGHSIPENPGKYIGTFQLQSGAFVFHVFEPDGNAKGEA